MFSIRDGYWLWADILAGMEKPRFRLVLVYRLVALGLPPGNGEAQVLFYEFR